MNERKEQLKVFVKILIGCICAGLYAWGGMEMKWLRRFLAPSIAGISLILFSKDWRAFFTMPLLILSSSLGYGAESLGTKIFKRFYVGLAFGASSNTFNFFYVKKKENLWMYVAWSVIALVSAFIVFGVWNPFINARHEEAILGLLIYLPMMLSAQGKN